MPKKRQSLCPCGVALPTHMAVLAPARIAYKHQCSCDRMWEWNETWVDKGLGEPNPFVAADKAAKKKRKT